MNTFTGTDQDYRNLAAAHAKRIPANFDGHRFNLTALEDWMYDTATIHELVTTARAAHNAATSFRAAIAEHGEHEPGGEWVGLGSTFQRMFEGIHYDLMNALDERTR